MEILDTWQGGESCCHTQGLSLAFMDLVGSSSIIFFTLSTKSVSLTFLSSPSSLGALFMVASPSQVPSSFLQIR
uniref:Uncharacterized protein n=1 Tax=Lepeophtheirus salmonis TaxID=72036 RepID=A0A0K2VI22_LEPSM